MSEKPSAILTVDDSPEDRETYRRMLSAPSQRPYAFLETGSGEEGLRLCRAERPACILLKYRLLDLDGLEFVAKLKENPGHPLPPIVMLTPQGNERVAVQAMKSGIQDYLVKGHFTPEGLRRAVHNAMDKVALENKI